MRSGSKAKFATASQHTFRIELVLDFSAPVTGIHAKETARRILDGLQLSTAQSRIGTDLRNAELLCHPLHRVVSLTMPARPEGVLQPLLDALDGDRVDEGR